MAFVQHIAIIMDGNRRWAKNKRSPVSFGYARGVQSLKKIIQYFVENKISYLTLFAFSTENWKRPKEEVSGIFNILELSVLKYESLLLSNKIRLHIMGDLTSLPQKTQTAFHKVCEKTKNHKGLNLILAINYGGRKEILEGVRKMYLMKKDMENLTEKEFESCLQSSVFPSPDLVIRTGGVKRVSNFCLWSSAYSEFYFSDLLWPDFNVKELEKALELYKQADRRFGGS